MAAELLVNEFRKPEVRYDLESFFYILMYMAVMYQGPNNDQVPFKDMPAFLRQWFEEKDMKQLGVAKHGMIHLLDEDFEADYLSFFTPYFEFLKPCIRKMREALQDPKKTMVTHEHWIKLMKSAVGLIPKERVPRFAPPAVTEQNRELYELSRVDFIDASTFINRQQLRLRGDPPGVHNVPGVVTDDGIGFFYLDVSKERAKKAEEQLQASNAKNDETMSSTAEAAVEQNSTNANWVQAAKAATDSRNRKFRPGSESKKKIPALQVVIAESMSKSGATDKTFAEQKNSRVKKSTILKRSINSSDSVAGSNEDTLGDIAKAASAEKDSRDSDSDSVESLSNASEASTAVDGALSGVRRSRIPVPKKSTTLASTLEVENADDDLSSTMKLLTVTELSTSNTISKGGTSTLKVSTSAEVKGRKHASRKTSKASDTGSASSGSTWTNNAKLSSTAEIRNNAAIERAKRLEQRNANKRDGQFSGPTAPE